MMRLPSKAASEVPGSTMRELTQAVIDDAGNRWPAGTHYQPLSVGHDNTSNRRLDYIIVTIGGRVVRFMRGRAATIGCVLLTLFTLRAAHAEDVFETAAANVRRAHPELQQAQDAAPRAHDCRETFSVRTAHAKLTAEYRAAYKRAKAQYKALAFYAENCRPLERLERLVRHEDSEWAFVCRKDRGAQPAGLTPQLLEDLNAFGIQPPDMDPNTGRAEAWTTFEARYFLALSPHAAQICAAYDAAVDAESSAIADEAVRLGWKGE